MSPEADNLKLFRMRAEAVAATVEEAPDLEAALTRAVALAAARAPGGVAAAPGWPPAETEALARLCADAGLTLAAGGLREHAGSLTVGITRADHGIAATGTLVIDCRDEDLRLATMLGDLHVAVLPAGKVAATAHDLAGELEGLNANPPAYTAFITGASRTADIERVLTIGVHGPAELTIILVGGRP